MGQRLREIEIGDWYDTPQSLQRFEVVAMDDGHRTLEIQYADGTVEEVEYESWASLEAESSAPPDDGTAAFDADHENLDGDWVNGHGSLDPLDDIDNILYG